jgi:sugar/nucleoside kinase (ribokinase family)
MTWNRCVDIMMIGHLAKDRLVVDGRGEFATGGGVYYGSIALRRLGLSVAVVTRLHLDDFWRLDELRAEGVEILAQAAPETSGIENVYDSADMERRICRPMGFAGAFRLEEIPDLAAKIYVAGGIMAGEIDLALLESLARRGPVALDVQGFVRVREGETLAFRPWPDMTSGLSLVTFLKVDRAEAELLTGETDLQAAAQSLAAYGPREVVVTQSSGVTVLADLPGALCFPLSGGADRPRGYLFCHLFGPAAVQIAAGVSPSGCRSDHAQAGNAGRLARDPGGHRRTALR